MTRRLWFLIALVYGLILLGLLTLQGELLALAIPLLVYLAAALATLPGRPQVEARRRLSANQVGTKQAQACAPVRVTLEITNLASRRQELWIQDQLPVGVTLVEGEPLRLARLNPGDTLRLEYAITACRGRYEFNPVTVTGTSIFGLLQRSQTLQIPGQLLVFPLPERIRPLTIHPTRTHGFSGPLPARRGGSGTSFYGVREYQPGDPLRRVNWKASTRHPQSAFTNEFEQERITDVGLVLDGRTEADVWANGDRLFEHSLQATATLAEAFLGQGHRVGMLIYGYGRSAAFPGYGRLQRQRILRLLAGAQTGELSMDSLATLPTRFLPARAQLVLVSPLLPDDLRLLSQVRANGYSILVVSPDPLSFELRRYPGSADLTSAMRIARLERRLLLAKFRRLGIQVLDWQVDASIDQVAWQVSGGMRPTRALGRG